jgi:ABC-type polysaccharide/polyol phosphate transport system ATPase subunit
VASIVTIQVNFRVLKRLGPAMAARARRGPPVPWLLGSGLAFMRNEQVIVRDINFTLHGGSAVVLTGPNASGKSSFLRVVSAFFY